jgi:hypothetical protein
MASVHNAETYFRGELLDNRPTSFPPLLVFEGQERWIRLHPCTCGVGVVLATTALGEWHGDLDITCVWRSGKEGTGGAGWRKAVILHVGFSFSVERNGVWEDGTLCKKCNIFVWVCKNLVIFIIPST